MSQLIIAVIVFVGGHVVISGTGLRAALVRGVGEKAFQGLFSVFALATLVWVALAYRAAPVTVAWEPPASLRWLTFVLVALAVWLVVAGVTTRNPSLAGQGDALKSASSARGVFAVTRHPVMWGITAWSIGHVLARGDQASLLMFGGFTVLALAGSLSQERKKRAQYGTDWDAFASATSHVPFAAIATGRAAFRLSEIGWRSPAIALVVFIGLIAAHPWMFGVSPLPG